MKPEIEADLAYSSGLAPGVDDSTAIFHRGGDRLFEINVQATCKTLDRGIGVQRRRYADDNGIDVAGIEELLVVREQAGIRGDLLAALPGFGIHFRDRTKTNTVEAY